MIEKYPLVQFRVVERGGPRMACGWGLTYKHERPAWVKVLLHKQEAEEVAQLIANAKSQEDFPIWYCRKWRVQIILDNQEEMLNAFLGEGVNL